MNRQQTLVLERLPETYGVARLPPGEAKQDVEARLAALGGPGAAGGFSSVTRTAEETSIVASMNELRSLEPRVEQDDWQLEGDFVLYRVAGTLDFALTGILTRLLVPLATEKISIFAISTYDTDWIMVPGARADDAEAAWNTASFRVKDPA